MPEKKLPTEVAAYLGGPLEWVSPFWTESEILAAIAEVRSWLHDDDYIYLPEAREQIACQLRDAREFLRAVRAREASGSISTELLTDFMSRFLGYGNPNAELWFVGMEEGGGSGLAELNRRLNAWDNGGRQAFEDLPAYYHRIGLAKNFLPPFPL